MHQIWKEDLEKIAHGYKLIKVDNRPLSSILYKKGERACLFINRCRDVQERFLEVYHFPFHYYNEIDDEKILEESRKYGFKIYKRYRFQCWNELLGFIKEVTRTGLTCGLEEIVETCMIHSLKTKIKRNE